MSSKLNWFASEITVVVVGVLIALALNAWWQNSQNAQSESHYLDQLVRNLEATIELHSSDSLDSVSYRQAAEQLMQTYRSKQSPNLDSIDIWLPRALNYKASEVSLGAVGALVNSDDLGLIKSETLRSAIPDYYYSMISRQGTMIEFRRSFREKALELIEIIDVMAAVLRSNGLELEQSYGVPREEVPQDDMVAAKLFSVSLLQDNLAGSRNTVLEESRALLHMIKQDR